MAINKHIITFLWKCSKIIPIPKKAKVAKMNDLRPIALTSVVMKSMFNNVQDPLQFAYS